MIRVENIYYMLSYAFRNMQETGKDAFSNESFDNGQVIACSMKMLKPLMQAVVPAWSEAAK